MNKDLFSRFKKLNISHYGLMFFLFVPAVGFAANEKPVPALCEQTLKQFPGKMDAKLVASACAKMQVLPGCQSNDGVPIYHYDKQGSHPSKQRILVFSSIHGDEIPAGSVVRLWLERLETIDPRNSWRVVPILNPDGLRLKTRTNAHKVDVNRNFPTKDWDEKAIDDWVKVQKKNPRRWPGPNAGSEPETQCAVKEIEDFKPSMVVSIHTPLKVLDFDGPKVKPPKFDYLPWKSLGNYPGSLGRYLWIERHVPVLTMEMKDDLPSTNQPILQLQDIIGFLVSLELGPKVSAAAPRDSGKATTGKDKKPAAPTMATPEQTEMPKAAPTDAGDKDPVEAAPNEKAPEKAPVEPVDQKPKSTDPSAPSTETPNKN